MVSYIGLPSLRCFSCEAAPLRQDDRAWGGWTPRPSQSQQRKATIPLLREPVSTVRSELWEYSPVLGVKLAVICARFL